MIRLLIADDHQVLLDGFRAMFDDSEVIQVVATARDGLEVISYLKDHEVDVILMDIQMPRMNGIETCKKVHRSNPDIKVIALSMYDQRSYFKRMIQYGASGYLLKNDSAEEIIQAILQVQEGQVYVSQSLKTQLLELDMLIPTSKLHTPVTEREMEVLRLVSEGYTDQQIANQLHLSHHTIHSHRKNLIIKLGAKNTAELVRRAIEKGLI
ncbi:MAG: response regulator transcription factor [Bacteroidota bacterium]